MTQLINTRIIYTHKACYEPIIKYIIINSNHVKVVPHMCNRLKVKQEKKCQVLSLDTPST